MGNQQGLLAQIPLGVLEIRVFLSSGYKKGASCMRVLYPGSGEGQKIFSAPAIS